MKLQLLLHKAHYFCDCMNWLIASTCCLYEPYHDFISSKDIQYPVEIIFIDDSETFNSPKVVGFYGLN